ncbi:MAG: twin-arginine translocase subunit TatC, partial [Chloroflexota bacterium]|nr:twin-arginine translocase subunit TatC [Chloroflexota bacterium]
AGAPPTPPPGDGAVMSLIDHLGELRSRLFRVVLAVAVGAVLGIVAAPTIIDILVRPLPGQKVIVLGPGDAFFINMKIAVVVGIILGMPVILYQLWAFVAPGLTSQERRVIRPWLPLAIFFFALGVVIAYAILPYATGFLLGFTNQTLVASIAAGPYFDFVTTMFLAFGLVMEFPIVLYALSRVNILSSQRLRASRRYAILGIVIFASVATPGGDLVSPFVLGLTMYVLYEATTWFIARGGR